MISCSLFLYDQRVSKDQPRRRKGKRQIDSRKMLPWHNIEKHENLRKTTIPSMCRAFYKKILRSSFINLYIPTRCDDSLSTDKKIKLQKS